MHIDERLEIELSTKTVYCNVIHILSKENMRKPLESVVDIKSVSRSVIDDKFKRFKSCAWDQWLAGYVYGGIL